MMSITDFNGDPFMSKKSLKAMVGFSVNFVETSMFGDEFKGAGTYCVVGPTPTQRKWYANVTVKMGERLSFGQRVPAPIVEKVT